MATVTPEIEWDSGSTTTNSYVIYSTAELPVLTTGTDALASRAINTIAINGKKVMMGIEVTEAYNNVAGEVTIQLSADGINWTANYATIIADSTPDVVSPAVKLGMVDLTSVDVPFFRLIFNGAGNSVGTSGQLKFRYIVPPTS